MFTMFAVGTLVGCIIGAIAARQYMRSVRRALAAELERELRAEFRRLDDRMEILEESVAAALKNRGEIISQLGELSTRYYRLADFLGPGSRAS
jgi:uncharacterized membrane-anchored protein YhcB (DUF1043 family)